MAGFSHSQIATMLIVEGALAHAAGSVRGKMPIEPVELSELERADIGLKQSGRTLFYPIPPTGVFVDFDGPTANVWFMQADADRALDDMEVAMKRAFPSVKQLKDEAHPNDKNLRVRSYEVDFGNSRLALVVSQYPARGAAPVKFQTHVTAQARRQ
ncbi:MAG: hypothetical protein AB7O98_10025 [Hyphomonadaceae bacterium]